MRRAIPLAIATAVVVACGSPRAAVGPAGAPSAPPGHLVLAGYETPQSGEAVSEEKFSIVDLATGEVTDRSVAQWGAGDAQFKLEEVGDELVFRGSDGTESGAWAVDPRLKGEPRHIGDAWYFVPSAVPGRLWLALLNEPLDHGQRPLRGVREVALSGEITVEDVDPPSDHIVGALRSGLVLQSDGLEVWDPAARQTVVRLAGVFPVDTHDDVLAWCDYGCEAVHIDDIGSGDSAVVMPDGPFRFVETYDGCFSPKGDLLGLEVELDDGGSRLGIVDVSGESTKIVHDIALDHHFPLCAWSTSGDTVYFNQGNGRIAAYELGSGAVRTYEIPPGRVVTALVVVD